MRETGTEPGRLGRVIVPTSHHYSLSKAIKLIGIGRYDLVPVAVYGDYRMDIVRLRETIDGPIADETPILAVIPSVGITEEGAVDPVHEVLALREDYEERRISFFVHVDEAYGG